MREGIDFEETFAPTAQPSSIRLIAAIATRLKLRLKTCDVETAFLNADMNKVVYVTTPPGYSFWENFGEKALAELPRDFIPSKEDVVKLTPTAYRQLLKGIPGIKQGSRLWYRMADGKLIGMGFTRHHNDP